jgi:hypothetical protein
MPRNHWKIERRPSGRYAGLSFARPRQHSENDPGSRRAQAIGIIGGIDGPTAIFLSGKLTDSAQEEIKMSITEVSDHRLLVICTSTEELRLQLPRENAFDQESPQAEQPTRLKSYADWGGCSDLDRLLSLGFNLERCMGLRFDTSPREDYYAATPSGGIVIAETGVDGMHLCLIPKAAATTLDDADVWPISPMDFDQTHSAVPPQFPFRELLRVFVTVPDASFLFELRNDMSPGQLTQRAKYHLDSLTADEQRERLVKAIQREFDVEPITNLFEYFFGPLSLNQKAPLV